MIKTQFIEKAKRLQIAGIIIKIVLKRDDIDVNIATHNEFIGGFIDNGLNGEIYRV